MSKPRILVIDSDSRNVQVIREQLQAKGYEVDALSKYQGTAFLRQPNLPGLILLDIQAPGATGMETISEIRRSTRVPIIVVSTKAEVMDRVQGLELGADDYVMKPFEPRELIARVHSVLRRWNEPETREWNFKGLTVQSSRRRVLLDNEPVELTTAEFDLLRMLVSQSQNVLSREKILEELRGIEWEAVDRSIDILVSRLRDKLRDDPRKPRFIRTVRSVGYQFVGEALPQAEQPVEQPAASASVAHAAN